MEVPTHFISCDWGTTNFRLRVVATDSLAVLAERATEMGVRSLNEQFKDAATTDRLAFFAAYLRTQLAELPTAHRGCQVVVSGMASANIGMRDLPYGGLPIGADAANFVWEDITPWPGQRLRLVSGVKSGVGMMRGEETQALGLLEVMAGSQDGVLLLPGTHSKHLTFEDGRFTDFTSYLTGELFEVLSQKSILSNSVAPGEWNDRTGEAFRAGVRAGFENGCPPHLFAIRAGHVLRQTDPTDNFYQLSGLLIGDELADLPRDEAKKIYLAGSGPLLRLYRFALEILGDGGRLTVYDDEVLGKALLSGQRSMLLRGWQAVRGADPPDTYDSKTNKDLASQQKPTTRNAKNTSLVMIPPTFSWEAFNATPVVAILRGHPLATCVKIAEALQATGFATLEVTMNTPDAATIIAELHARFPGLNVGAGTVCTPAELEVALGAGSSFIVTPIIDEEVIRTCVERGVPVFPGAYTPTEIYRAWSLGASAVKVFPAGGLGVQYLKDLSGPLPQIKLVPTGGVSLANIRSFFTAGVSGVGMGSSLLDKGLIAAGDFTGLRLHFQVIREQIQNPGQND